VKRRARSTPAATLVLNAAAQLTSQSEQLETETGKFLGNIRAA
jgi:methyl-accepting chemotaxis protein